MNLSGIIVLAKPEWQANVVEALNAMEGVEVHMQESDGRIVVIQEENGIRSEIEGLDRIKAVPHVIRADMVYHYFAEDDEVWDEIPPELMERDDSPACTVPAYLND